MELRQIHKVRSIDTVEFYEDQRTGQARRRTVQSFVPDDTDRIKHQGETYEIQPDGSFYVPVELAAFLTRQPDWYDGPNPFQPVRGIDEPAKAARKPRATAAA